MLATTIIKKPLITEKANFASSEFKRYAFEVDRRATKTEIKNAVESLYNVRVVGVSTQNRKGRMRRYRYGAVVLPTTKQATIRVHADDAIDLF
jgi:large subunit ribosomal protein L23